MIKKINKTGYTCISGVSVNLTTEEIQESTTIGLRDIPIFCCTVLHLLGVI